MDVGELLTSSKDRGNVHVVGGDKILYEQPDLPDMSLEYGEHTVEVSSTKSMRF